MTLSRMADVTGIRVICSSLAGTLKVAERLRTDSHWSRTLDYLSNPQDTGYRGLHEILRVSQHLPSGKEINIDVEVQVRSYWQHLWALQSECLGEQVKEGGGSSKSRKYLHELSGVIEKRERVEADREQEALPETGPAISHGVIRSREKGKPEFFTFERMDTAVRQLSSWESDLGGGERDSLLVVGRGDLGSLKLSIAFTHAVFLGMKEPPLEPWMPKWAAP